MADAPRGGVGRIWIDGMQAASSHYELFGLTFETAEPIPGLAPSDAAPVADAVRVDFAPVPERIEGAEYADETVQAGSDDYLFLYPEVLRLRVEGDRRIVVERLAGADPVRVWTAVLGIGPSVVGFRRGFMPLHASSILTPEGCVAFAGQSGSGKSTLAATLVARGHDLFADDLCLVRHEAGRHVAGRGVPELRLWDDAVAALDLGGVEPFAVQPNIPKSVFRRAASAVQTAPLRRIYCLDYVEDADEAGISRLTGVGAMQALVGRLRIRTGVLGVGRRETAFERLAAIADHVEVFRFARPIGHDHAPAWLDRLAAHLEE